MTSRTVLIYAKPPRIGLSKTRLAASLSPTEARRIAHMTLARSVRAAMDPRWQTRLYCAPDRALGETLGGRWPVRLPRHSQGAGDLGARLHKGLYEAPRGAVIFMGTDAPDLSPALIWRGFQLLRCHDAVFGPASDGGFWLFGVHKRLAMPRLFSPVRWSGPHALSDLKGNLPDRARVAHLPTLIDIDDVEDWRAWHEFHRKES